MLRKFIISYDISEIDEKDRAPLRVLLLNLGARHILTTTWILETELSLQAIWKYLPGGKSLRAAVFEVGREAAWQNLTENEQQDTEAWMGAHFQNPTRNRLTSLSRIVPPEQ